MRELGCFRAGVTGAGLPHLTAHRYRAEIPPPRGGGGIRVTFKFASGKTARPASSLSRTPDRESAACWSSLGDTGNASEVQDKMKSHPAFSVSQLKTGSDDQGRLEKAGFGTAWCHSILQAGQCVRRE